MSVGYRAVQWNRQKKAYDLTLFAVIALGLSAYVGISRLLRPELTLETLAIRGLALSGFVLLHVILCIGPLARLDRRFLPLLYNRRHLGVTMFFLGLAHATFAIVQFHGQADVNPLISVFTAYRRDYDPFVSGSVNLAHFPFEPLGAAALVILFLMAATSHDFWLRNLGPSVWKALHLSVLVAYGLLVGHVAYGVLQSETSPAYVVLLALGVCAVFGLHATAAIAEHRADRAASAATEDGFIRACRLDELVAPRGKVVLVLGERIALYRVGDRVFALSNVCRHQGGPLGEGRLIEGCITCPWHGWQYRPEDGCSPPPFAEKVETYRVRIVRGEVWVDPHPAAPGTPQAGARAGREP